MLEVSGLPECIEKPYPNQYRVDGLRVFENRIGLGRVENRNKIFLSNFLFFNLVQFFIWFFKIDWLFILIAGLSGFWKFNRVWSGFNLYLLPGYRVFGNRIGSGLGRVGSMKKAEPLISKLYINLISSSLKEKMKMRDITDLQWQKDTNTKGQNFKCCFLCHLLVTSLDF